MSTKSPLFSIVIPTRNRSHLLPHALRSALSQDFDDFEIVIAANDCKDNTREVVQNMATRRVRYFETDKMLTMPENWEFAWTKAKGKYVTYLCDDDALVPSALKVLAEKTLDGTPPVISWEDTIYYYSDWHDANIQNALLLFFHGNTDVEDIDASTMHKQLSQFDFPWSCPIPKLLNCAVNREYFENWRTRLGKIFFPIAPDYSFAWLSTQVCPTIRVLHKPLSVRGISDYSIGSNAGLGSAGQAFLKEFGEFNFFSELQSNLPLTLNHLAATFFRVNSALRKDKFPIKEFDMAALNVALAKQLMENKKILPEWEKYAAILLDESQKISPKSFNLINKIFTTINDPVEQIESLRDLHKRTRKMALEYLPNLTTALRRHSDDLYSALSSLALNNEMLVDANWSYMYLFGEALQANNIYAMSTHVDRYYDLLVNGRNKFKPEESLTQGVT